MKKKVTITKKKAKIGSRPLERLVIPPAPIKLIEIIATKYNSMWYADKVGEKFYASERCDQRTRELGFKYCQMIKVNLRDRTIFRKTGKTFYECDFRIIKQAV